jgi:hypothetical protein
MKMPRRPFFPPTYTPPDIFGLQRLTLLGEACEATSERTRRIAKVEAGVHAAFRAAIDHLGEEAARELFRIVLRKPKRGAGKALAPDRDQRLLAAYDALQSGESVAALARRLHASIGIELGNTPEAIESHIGQLVKKREKLRRAAAIDARQWRMAMRNEPPTLLGGLMRKK